MDTEQPAVFRLFYRYSVVQILGFSAVYGEYGHTSQVFAVVEGVFLHAALMYLPRFLQYFIREFIRCSVTDQYGSCTRSCFFCISENTCYPYLVFGMTPSAVGYLSEDLVAVAEISTADLLYYHMILCCTVRDKIRSAVHILYPAGESLTAEGKNVHDLAFRLSRT